MDSDFEELHVVDGTDDHQADDELEGWTVYRIFHAMDLGDFSVFVSPKDGAPATRRAALYCQFKAEAWFGDEVMLSNLGIASLLVQFYDHQPAPRVQGLHPDWFIDCRRRSKSEPPCRPNIEPGVEAGLEMTGCG